MNAKMSDLRPSAAPALQDCDDLPRVSLRGMPLTALGLDECVEFILARSAAGQGGWVVTPNVDILRRWERDATFRELVADATLMVADGVPLVWASWAQRTPLPGRVNGTDLVVKLNAAAASLPVTVFFLGGAPGAAVKAAKRMRRIYPELRVAGTFCPPYGYEKDPAQLEELTNAVCGAKPDIVFVGLGCPKQELLIDRLRSKLPGTWWLGIGASFSMISGADRRAPRWMQAHGLEWCCRLLQEPRRLSKRYLPCIPFAVKLLAGAAMVRLTGKPMTTALCTPVNDTPPSDVVRTSEAAKSNAARQAMPVSVIVPCFNEAPGIPHLRARLEEVEQSVAERYDLNFILVDDGSTDDTWERLRETCNEQAHYQLIRHADNRGIAAAIMTGIRSAKTEIVCSIDSDCTYDPLQLKDMIPNLDEDVDLVTASPYHPQGKVRNISPWRLRLSHAASSLYRRLLQHKLHCYTSCFRVYRRSACATIELRNPGFVGVAELVWQVEARGSRIVEVPAVLESRKIGNSNMRLLSTTAGHLRLMSRMLLANWGQRIWRGIGRGHSRFQRQPHEPFNIQQHDPASLAPTPQQPRTASIDA